MSDEVFVLSCCKTAVEHETHLKIREAISFLKKHGFEVYVGGFKQ